MRLSPRFVHTAWLWVVPEWRRYHHMRYGFIAMVSGRYSDFLMLSLLVLFGNRSIRAYLMAQAMDRSNQIPLSLAVRQLFDQRSDQVIKGLGFWLIHTVEILLYLFPLLVRFFSGGAAVSSWIAMFTMLVGYSILNYQDHHGSAKLSNIGSLIFWLGVFLSAIEAIHGILQWGIFISAFIIRIWTLRKIFIQQ